MNHRCNRKLCALNTLSDCKTFSSFCCQSDMSLLFTGLTHRRKFGLLLHRGLKRSEDTEPARVNSLCPQLLLFNSAPAGGAAGRDHSTLDQSIYLLYSMYLINSVDWSDQVTGVRPQHFITLRPVHNNTVMGHIVFSQYC